ncbi:uncharacterized protein LOC129763192 [Toxorhynchites rutilus septentrionalis]|uniref:uncharacterized protein LOC129763192 n=1 Tax=Toxorhynchites rutilus septentrionalis TaxID=329112 RepID=UPI0024791B69|nr:uncharacterized protein LOC129763192 [Toxorhynchites rutilus septentrionalis]XP_055617998.1 uncharacterized protein LOC129763192 [Toxorhynchites rutilus septentrionalis]
MKIGYTVVTIFLLLVMHVVWCTNGLNETKSEKLRNSNKPRKSGASVIERNISFHNRTDATNNTTAAPKNIVQINTFDTRASKNKRRKGKLSLICPQERQAPFQLFTTTCRRNRECTKTNSRMKCCNLFGSKRCVEGVRKPIPEPPHGPIFGVPRRCPEQPLTETFWDIKTCEDDNDCWPRICCPDGDNKYCRTSQPLFEKSPNPAARQLAYPIEAFSQYLQCTPAPPVIFDIHPKACNSTLDCFPNLCCLEAGKRHCRPPRKSLLSLVTGLTSRINIGVLKDFTENLVIRR